MHPRRHARFNELVAQVVSNLIPTIKDPLMGFVTITGAEVSPDITLARIFYSVYGSEEEKANTRQALERAKSYFRRELAQLENMRRVPQIMFVYDGTVERADRVNQILQVLKDEHVDQPADQQENPKPNETDGN